MKYSKLPNIVTRNICIAEFVIEYVTIQRISAEIMADIDIQKNSENISMPPFNFILYRMNKRAQTIDKEKNKQQPIGTPIAPNLFTSRNVYIMYKIDSIVPIIAISFVTLNE